MNQGKLNITKSKKGKLIVKVLFENDKGKSKELTVQDANISEENNGKDIEFESEGGQIVKIVCEGETLFLKREFPKKPPKKNQKKPSNIQIQIGSGGQMQIEHIDQVGYPAYAPYNFIPLNEKVVEAEEIPNFDKYHNDRYTGWIDLEIETKTPLYIRDTLNEDERKKNDKAKKDNKEYDNPEFFSPGGKLRIPGSSIRGMTRNMLEIVSFGKFSFFDDKRLYYRSFADVTITLRQDYVRYIIQKTQGAYNIKPVAGYLKRQAGKFVIVPASVRNNTTYYKVEESLLIGKSFYPHQMSSSFKNKNGETRYKPNTNYKFFTKKVFFNNTPPKVHKHTEVDLYYGKITNIDLVNPGGWAEGTLICTGWIPSRRNGKHMHWVINELDINEDPLPIKENLMQSYKDDVNREEQADLLEQLKAHPEGVPCFYITNESGEVTSFGHTGMFRLAYEKTIGEHVPDNLKDESKIDLAEAIFGNEKKFAGRVFFEDAFLKEGQQNVQMGIKTPKILSSPKPTTFQHYLVQNEDDKKRLNHYNSNFYIRGYKFYWHRSGNKWEQTNRQEIEKHKTQYTKINPVKPKTSYSGRIRFENLSKVELGALLFSLALPEGCCHKLGMGKPLGLGSVRITPRLCLSDRQKRYTDLFAEWGDEVAPESEQNINALKNDFEKYVLRQIGESNQKSLWDIERLKELRVMLDYETGKKLESKTQYMEIERKSGNRRINDFKNRPILPKPSNVR